MRFVMWQQLPSSVSIIHARRRVLKARLMRVGHELEQEGFNHSCPTEGTESVGQLRLHRRDGGFQSFMPDGGY